MTVTINTLGSNSRSLTISGEVSATNIIDGVTTALTALGWTLIDTVTSGSRGLLTTKVYSAPNADTVTTKYMIIRYDLHRQYWFVSCCESWNTTTNVATNESWSGGRQILLPLQYSNCTLYVWATARYAAFMGVVQNEPSAWQGVFEFERAATEDIAANTVPCFGWTSSLTIGEPYGNINNPTSTVTTSASNGFVACGFAPPRTANGLTGIAVANNFSIITILGAYPPFKPQIGADWTTGGVTQTINSHCGMLGAWGEGQTYAWDSNKTLINDIALCGYSGDYLLGRIYGLKVTPKIGAVLDTATVPVNANLFYSAAGTPTTHYLLGINGGYCDKPTVAANRLTSTTYTSGTAIGTPWQSVFVSGRYLYFTTTTGFHKFDLTNQNFTLNIIPAAAYYSVKFDGENSLYVTTAGSNIYKLNLSNDTYTTLTIANNWSGLAIDDDNLYVAVNSAGATVTVKRIALSTFTEAASYTVSTGDATNKVTHMSTADYSGFLYVGTMLTSTATACRIVKIARSDGTQSPLTLGGGNLATTASGGQPLFFDGSNLYFFNFSGTGSSALNGRLYKLDLTSFTLTINGTSFTGADTGSNTYMSVNMVNLGSCELPSFAGMTLISVAGGAAAGSTLRIIPVDPRLSNTQIQVATPILDATNPFTGQYSTDCCSFYGITSTTNRVVRYTNATRNYNFNGVQSANILIPQ